MSCLAVLLQHSGWWPSASGEEGLRAVWVCLSDEHSHRVLLPQWGERCVLLLFHLLLCTWTSSWSAGRILRILTVSQRVSWLWAPSVRTQCLCVRVPPGCRSLSSVASLESPVICCLGPLIQYLREFNLERVLRSERYIAQRHGTDLAAQVQSVLMQCFLLSTEMEIINKWRKGKPVETDIDLSVLAVYFP